MTQPEDGDPLAEDFYRTLKNKPQEEEPLLAAEGSA